LSGRAGHAYLSFSLADQSHNFRDARTLLL